MYTYKWIWCNEISYYTTNLIIEENGIIDIWSRKKNADDNTVKI